MRRQIRFFFISSKNLTNPYPFVRSVFGLITTLASLPDRYRAQNFFCSKYFATSGAKPFTKIRCPGPTSRCLSLIANQKSQYTIQLDQCRAHCKQLSRTVHLEHEEFLSFSLVKDEENWRLIWERGSANGFQYLIMVVGSMHAILSYFLLPWT